MSVKSTVASTLSSCASSSRSSRANAWTAVTYASDRSCMTVGCVPGIVCLRAPGISAANAFASSSRAPPRLSTSVGTLIVPSTSRTSDS